jgi:hypothetical protein
LDRVALDEEDSRSLLLDLADEYDKQAAERGRAGGKDVA